MRRLAVILALAACAVLAFAVAAPAAGGPPFLSLSQKTVHLDHAVTIKGSQWPVIEFCRRTVRLRLESAQNAVLIGFSHVKDNGRFTRHFTPRTGKIGPGKWKVVARLRCESGQDGSPNFIVRRKALRILP
jgi:hypothetical protein